MASPITVCDVANHLGAPHPDANLASVVDAGVAMVERWKGVPIEQWPDQWRLGAIMLIARLDRRRNSPSGVDTVSEMGPVYVSRKDPDVAQLLEIGAWSIPEVG